MGCIRQFLPIAFVFAIAVLYAQKLPTPEELEKAIIACNKIAYTGDFEGGFACLETLRPQVEATPYNQVIFLFYSNIAEFHMVMGEYKRSLSTIDEAIEKYENLLTDEQKVGLEIIQLQVLEIQQHSDLVFERIQKLLPKTENWRYKASLYTLRASARTQIGDYEAGINDLYEALKLFESKKDTVNIITLFNRIGLVHNELDKNDKALEVFEKAYRYAKDFKNVESLSSVYNNLGVAHQGLGNLDQAIAYYLKGLDLAEKKHFQMDKARFLSNLGEVYLHKEDLPNAFKYLYESLRISKESNISKGVLYNYRSLAKAYLEVKNFSESQKCLDSALKYSKYLIEPKMEADVMMIYSDLFERKFDYKNALNFYKAGDSIDKILKREDARKALSDLEMKYQSELKDQDLEKIQLAFDKNKAENTVLRVGVGGGIVVFGMILIFMSYRNQTLKKLYERNIELLQTVKYYKISPEVTDEREQLKIIFDKLLELLTSDKIFTNPLLGIKDVAEMLNTNEKYVSSAISKYANMNYSNFINFYRINEAKDLINEMELNNFNEIMQASGFNSRTTFYNAFKNFTGLSPTQFRNMKMEAQAS